MQLWESEMQTLPVMSTVDGCVKVGLYIDLVSSSLLDECSSPDTYNVFIALSRFLPRARALIVANCFEQ